MEIKVKDAGNTFSLMDGFVKGMGNITLFPQLPDTEPDVSPWQGVLNAFADANRNLTEAIHEFKKTDKHYKFIPNKRAIFL
jgi:hypothetical protein